MARYIPVTIDEAEEEKKGGNIGLPFGLCAKYGIYLPSTATPRDAWNALKNKTGMAPEDFYRDLRKKKDGQDGQVNGEQSKDEATISSLAESKRLKELGIEEVKGHVLETVPREDRAQYIQNQLGVSSQKAKEYSEALYFYTDYLDNVKKLRAYQMGENVKNVSEIARREQDLEDYIENAPKWNGGETFRGVKLTEDELSRYEVCSEHNMLGTSSWSSNEDIAIGYSGYGNSPSGKQSVVFHSPTQTNGTSVRHLSPFANEDEVLVSKKSKYRVLKMFKSQDGINHIYLEEA